ncbi:ATP-dependent DNA helicase RecG [Desulfobacterota bacterium AH_259_B03_O07]|nr:ATP-dependent DNA helicase RecG [Desulfobacterota bacterium AH_259_B03_O07]
MNAELLTILEALEKPLRFVSKADFQNITKVKDLDQLVQDLALKALSLSLNEQQIKVIQSFRESFKVYKRLDEDDKKGLINRTLNTIFELKGKGQNYKTPISTEYMKVSKLDSDIDDLSKISIQFVKGVGPRIAKTLAKKGIITVEDSLYYFPRKYEDRRLIKKISALSPYMRETVMGTIVLSGRVRLRSRGIYQVIISDGTGTIALIWYQFNSKYLNSTYKKGSFVILSGDITISKYNNSLQIIHPSPDDVEIIEKGQDIEKDMLNFNRIVPIYPLTEGIKQRRIRRIESTVIENYRDKITDFIPNDLMKRNRVMSLGEAIKRVHFPDGSDPVVDLSDNSSVYNSIPHRTISFHEFFLLELGLAIKKRDISRMPGIAFKPTGALTEKLLSRLPFELTTAQKRVISEIENDMSADIPMNRLLQGDVGSGKTIVALLSLLKAVESGYQAVLMAPTEILAEQHLSSVGNYVDKFGIQVVLLKSAQGKKEKDSHYEAIRSGEAKIIIGTHALLQEKVEFENLGFIVIDEQHRFGVVQRASLRSKGKNPDVLVMTATPIPRTLAMTVYGDLDVSILDEMPPHRRAIRTHVFYEEKGARRKAYEIVHAEVKKGRQVYVVYPLIEESERQDFKELRFATQMFEELKNNIFPEFRLGLVHGRMKSDEKDRVMKRFISHEIDILVATTVIEVGIDILNATVMLVEHAERYGLSQLHQLRGRVGRGKHQSLCILMSGSKRTDDARKRLSILKETSDGFRLAEADLVIRGPGDFIGTKQSGLPEFRFANLLRDSKILSEARREAFKIVSEDPTLEGYRGLYKEVVRRWGESLELAGVS